MEHVRLHQCYKCMGFLHLRPQCTESDTICSRCGQVHTHSYLECTAPPTCANCGGSHPATAKICPIYLEQFNQHEIAILRQLIAKHPQSAQTYLANSFSSQTFNSQKEEINELRNILRDARRASNNVAEFSTHLFNASSQLLIQDPQQHPQTSLAMPLPESNDINLNNASPVIVSEDPQLSSTPQISAAAPPPIPANSTCDNLDKDPLLNDLYINYPPDFHPTEFDCVDSDLKISRNNKCNKLEWYPKQILSWAKGTGEIINSVIIILLHVANKTLHLFNCHGKTTYIIHPQDVQRLSWNNNELVLNYNYEEILTIKFYNRWDGRKEIARIKDCHTAYSVFQHLACKYGFNADILEAKYDYEEYKKDN